MTPDDLLQIKQRYELQYVHDGGETLEQEDIQALIDEVENLWKLRQHLIALNRQTLARLDKQGASWQHQADHLDALQRGTGTT